MKYDFALNVPGGLGTSQQGKSSPKSSSSSLSLDDSPWIRCIPPPPSAVALTRRAWPLSKETRQGQWSEYSDKWGYLTVYLHFFIIFILWFSDTSLKSTLNSIPNGVWLWQTVDCIYRAVINKRWEAGVLHQLLWTWPALLLSKE